MPLVANVYSSNEIVTLLASVGCTDVGVPGGYHGGAPTELDGFHVFIAAATGPVRTAWHHRPMNVRRPW